MVYTVDTSCVRAVADGLTVVTGVPVKFHNGPPMTNGHEVWLDHRLYRTEWQYDVGLGEGIHELAHTWFKTFQIAFTPGSSWYEQIAKRYGRPDLTWVAQECVNFVLDMADETLMEANLPGCTRYIRRANIHSFNQIWTLCGKIPEFREVLCTSFLVTRLGTSNRTKGETTNLDYKLVRSMAKRTKMICGTDKAFKIMKAARDKPKKASPYRTARRWYFLYGKAAELFALIAPMVQTSDQPDQSQQQHQPPQGDPQDQQGDQDQSDDGDADQQGQQGDQGQSDDGDDADKQDGTPSGGEGDQQDQDGDQTTSGGGGGGSGEQDSDDQSGDQGEPDQSGGGDGDDGDASGDSQQGQQQGQPHGPGANDPMKGLRERNRKSQGDGTPDSPNPSGTPPPPPAPKTDKEWAEQAVEGEMDKFADEIIKAAEGGGGKGGGNSDSDEPPGEANPNQSYWVNQQAYADASKAVAEVADIMMATEEAMVLHRPGEDGMNLTGQWERLYTDYRVFGVPEQGDGEGLKIGILLDCSYSMDHMLPAAAGVCMAFAETMHNRGAEVRVWKFSDDRKNDEIDWRTMNTISPQGGTLPLKATRESMSWLIAEDQRRIWIIITDGELYDSQIPQVHAIVGEGVMSGVEAIAIGLDLGDDWFRDQWPITMKTLTLPQAEIRGLGIALANCLDRR